MEGVGRGEGGLDEGSSRERSTDLVVPRGDHLHLIQGPPLPREAFLISVTCSVAADSYPTSPLMLQVLHLSGYIQPAACVLFAPHTFGIIS